MSIITSDLDVGNLCKEILATAVASIKEEVRKNNDSRLQKSSAELPKSWPDKEGSHTRL